MAASDSDRTLADYLVRLVISSELRAEFEKDPGQTVEASGLNPKKQKILLSRDLTKILNEVADEFGISPGDHMGG